MAGKISKRNFLKYACTATAGIYGVSGNSIAEVKNRLWEPAVNDTPWKWSKESTYYEVTPRGTKCLICPNECTLKTGETSICHNRINLNGKLYTIAYGNPCAMHIDPVEKKPLFQYMPGTRSFSIATAGCNFSCLNCQNWAISQSGPRETDNFDLMPVKVVEETLKADCKSIAYTYSEPVTFYEYVLDTATLAKKSGLKNIMVSNGFINEKPLRALCKVVDAATIDLKSFDETIYMKLNDGKLQPVLDTLSIYKEEGVWLEISNLVIPSWSDDAAMIKKMCDWLYKNGFQDTPLHFLRFQPLYKLTQLPPTPIPVLENAKKTALDAGIKFVYIGNIPGSEAISTVCPKCKKIIVERKGFTIVSNQIKNGNCGFCGEQIPGVWN
jgi:pyruvate formate lyase activating enzyme